MYLEENKVRIYVNMKKKAKIIAKKTIYIKDIAEIVVNNESIANSIENTIVTNLTSDEEKSYIISSVEVIKTILKKYENAEIINIGEDTTIIFYRKKESHKYSLFNILKVTFISAVLFIGAMTTIMCFHNDSDVKSVLENFYYIIFGQNLKNPPVIIIPYSIGLLSGVIGFFGHFLSFDLTKDPSPIEIQLTSYNNEMLTNIKETLENKEN